MSIYKRFSSFGETKFAWAHLELIAAPFPCRPRVVLFPATSALEMASACRNNVGQLIVIDLVWEVAPLFRVAVRGFPHSSLREH